MIVMESSDTYTKDPQAVLDYRWGWAAWLAAAETIVSATVFIDGGDGALTLNSSLHDASTVTGWLSGGTLDTRYVVTCRVVTDQGRTDDRSLFITVRDR